MRFFTTAIMACLVIASTNSQFNNGQGSFFTFNQGPSSQSAPAFRPPQQQAAFRPPQQQQPFRPQQQPFRQQAPVAQAAPGGAGGCTPTPNYQSGNRNFWVSWRSKILSDKND